MARRRHVPPSRIRYEQANPTVSARVPLELHDRLKSMREQSGKSLTDVLKQALAFQEPSVKRSYRQGLSRGKAESERIFRVDYRCKVCGGTLTVTSEEEKRAVAQYMRDHGWAHITCSREHR